MVAGQNAIKGQRSANILPSIPLCGDPGMVS
jgi:hypothetical protein